VLQGLEGVSRLVACLRYRAPLRGPECCRLPVQDVGFAANQRTLRGGQGDKDRATMLPAAVKANLARHLEVAGQQQRRDLERGPDWVALPAALARKYPNAGREWRGFRLIPVRRTTRRSHRLVSGGSS